MFMPFDPVMMLVAVVAMVCYYALKGSGKHSKGGMKDWTPEQWAEYHKDVCQKQYDKMMADRERFYGHTWH